MHEEALQEERVVFDALQDGDCFGYPLVRIVGRLDYSDKRTSAKNGIVLIQGKSKSEESKPSKWPLYRGCFKALILLTPGRNKIRLICRLRNDANTTSPESEQIHEIMRGLTLFYKPNLGKFMEPTAMPRFVRMVYLLSSDDEGDYQAPPGVSNTTEDAIARLKFAALLMQSFCADGMMKHGFGRRTFRLELDEDGSPKVWVVRASGTRKEIYAVGDEWKDQGKGWGYFHSELEKLPQRENSIDCAIMSMTRQLLVRGGNEGEKETETEKEKEKEEEKEREQARENVNKEEKATEKEQADGKEEETGEIQATKELTKGKEKKEKESKREKGKEKGRAVKLEKKLFAHTAMGGGRLGLFGSGCLHTWATGIEDIIQCWSDNRDLSVMFDSEGNPLMDDSCYRKSMWSNFATTLGATMHEVGHCFGLPHSYRGIMWRGFDNFNRFFMIQEKGIDGPLVDEKFSKNGKGEGGAYWDRHAAFFLRNSPHMYPMHAHVSDLPLALAPPAFIEILLDYIFIQRKSINDTEGDSACGIVAPASEWGDVVVQIDALGAPIVQVEFRSDSGTVFWHVEFDVTGDSRRDTFAWSVTLWEVMDMFVYSSRIYNRTKETCTRCLVRVLNASGRLEEEYFDMPSPSPYPLLLLQ